MLQALQGLQEPLEQTAQYLDLQVQQVLLDLQDQLVLRALTQQFQDQLVLLEQRVPQVLQALKV